MCLGARLHRYQEVSSAWPFPTSRVEFGGSLMTLHHSPLPTPRPVRQVRLGGKLRIVGWRLRVSGSGRPSTGSAGRSSRCWRRFTNSGRAVASIAPAALEVRPLPPPPGGVAGPKATRSFRINKTSRKSQKAKPTKATESQLWRAMDRRKPFGISTRLHEPQSGVGPNPARATESHDTNPVSQHTRTRLGRRPFILQPRRRYRFATRLSSLNRSRSGRRLP